MADDKRWIRSPDIPCIRCCRFDIQSSGVTHMATGTYFGSTFFNMVIITLLLLLFGGFF
jgi:hypothetical protein